MPTYKYVADRQYFLKRPIPRLPGSVEYMFYIAGKDLPDDVPHEKVNPREQNINRPVYQKIAESFKDSDDMFFHMKNKGVTVLASGVRESQVGDKIILDVDVPDELGNVDGQHTSEIIAEYKAANPEQLVHVKIQAQVPMQLISPIARGLNTTVQVTSATMADHLGLFREIREVLEPYEYANWIGYRQNAQNVSATSKDLVSFMWVCNPTIFEDNPAWCPSWVYSRGAAVYEKFFNEKEVAFRERLLKMVYVLPDIIALYRYINETVSEFFKKKRTHLRGRIDADVDGRKEYEMGVEDLCITSIGRPFRNPADRRKHKQLKECYRLILVSGLRALLEENPTTKFIEWKLDYPLVREILDNTLKKVYVQIVKSLRQNKRDHNATSRQPAVWDIPANTFMMLYLSEYQKLGKTLTGRPPYSQPESDGIMVTHGQQEELDFDSLSALGLFDT